MTARSASTTAVPFQRRRTHDRIPDAHQKLPRMISDGDRKIRKNSMTRQCHVTEAGL